MEKNNYFNLVALIANIACNVIWKYITEKILGRDSFETFVSREKHKLVHLYETTACCECMSGPITGYRHISRRQLLVLYNSDEQKKVRRHLKYTKGKLTQICICNFHPKKNVNVRVVDISLAHYIIQQFGKEDQTKGLIEKIQDSRNYIFHLSDIKEITENEFKSKWKELSDSILKIANLIEKRYADDTEKKIKQTEKLTIIEDYMLMYENVCRDYWKNKCAEFERVEMQDFKDKIAALNYNFPQDVDRSMVNDLKETMSKIPTYCSMIDQIKILMQLFGDVENRKVMDGTELEENDMQTIYQPVFLRLDIPTSWDKTKICEVIDEMRLNGTPDMNIRIKVISTDDLNILTEIASQLLCKVEEVGPEIHKVISTLISKASIVTTEPECVYINLKIPEKSESLLYAKAQVRVESSLQLRINVHMKFSVDHSSTNVGKCVIINGLFVFVANDSDKLRVYNEDGFYRRHINLSGTPLFISVMNEYHVAVVFEQNYIEVVTINTGQVKNHIVTKSCVSGISYQNQLLYVCVDQRKVNVMNLKGKVTRSFTCPSFPVSYLASDVDRLFFSETIGDSLYCCDLIGTVIWKFTNDHIRGSIGLTIDDIHNVYVSCSMFNTLLLISMEGYHYKELLTEKDGLGSPGGIYYDKSKNNLLVCNTQNNDALLFYVEH